MAYQISYGQTMEKTPITEKRILRLSKKQRTIIITAVLSAGLAVLSQRKSFQDALLPGNSQVTREAISGMISDLQAGELLGDAVRAFCQEIVDNAQIPK